VKPPANQTTEKPPCNETPHEISLEAAYASNPALSDEYHVRWRVDGRLRNVCRLDQSVGRALLTQYKVIGNLDIADPFHGQEGRLRLPPALATYEVRVTAMPVAGGGRRDRHAGGQFGQIRFHHFSYS
jgi:hypothetical protein